MTVAEYRSVFERHPRLTLGAVLVLLTSSIAGVTEFLLPDSASPFTTIAKVERHVRLRELPPDLVWIAVPSEEQLSGSDGLVRREYSVRTDDAGFMMPSRIHDAPDLTIIFLGGSTTECVYNDETKRWPYQVGRLIEQQTGLRINAINGGKGGSHSLHSITVLLSKVIPLEPDFVVLMHNINDFAHLLHHRSYWNRDSERSIVISRPVNQPPLTQLALFAKSIRNATIPKIYFTVKRLFGQQLTTAWHDNAPFAPVPTSGKVALTDTQFRKSLRTFVAIARIWGCIPVLMTQSNRLGDEGDRDSSLAWMAVRQRSEEIGLGYGEFKRQYDQFNQAVRQVATEERRPADRPRS